MTNITKTIGMVCGRVARVLPCLLVLAGLMAVGAASAQVLRDDYSTRSTLDTIPEEDRAVFEQYVQKEDTAKLAMVNKHRRDKFVKRISLHTNIIDWATLVPNFGIEIDLKDNVRTNYSVAIFGKFNGNSTHGKLIYNINALRVEGRRYWRTGKYGSDKNGTAAYYDSFERLYADTASAYFNVDTFARYSYYVDTLGVAAKAMGVRMSSIRETNDMTQAQRDSLDFAEDSLGVRTRNFRAWVYNTYHRARRNITSGRTLENPRNWRAYYFGLWAGIDNWSISLTGKGRQGKGVGAGAVFGYTLPLFPQEYPREGSLDLDLGIAVGWKAVNYMGYTYEEQTQHYVHDPARSTAGWKFVPYPIVQDIHVSLVWRFRGIKSKVDRSLIDDYGKRWVDPYKNRLRDADNKLKAVKRKREDIIAEMNRRRGIMTDSTQRWDDFHRRRFDAAVRINPDTTFVGAEHELYLRVVKGLRSKEAQTRFLKEQREDSIRMVKEARADSIRLAKEARADSIRLAKEARADSVRLAKERRAAEKALADSLEDARRDSIRMAEEAVEVSDSIAVPEDSVPVIVIPGDSVPATAVPEDSVPATEPQSESAPEGESEGEPQPESAPEGESEGEPHPESAPEGESEGEPQPESAPEGESEGEPQPESAPEGESEGEPQPESAPEGESEGEPQPESAPEGESEGEPDKTND